MALADYTGPANNTDILKFFVGEAIKAALVGNDGRIWLIVPSGHALIIGAFNRVAAAFEVADPKRVQEEVDARKKDLQEHIQNLRDVAPGIDL